MYTEKRVLFLGLFFSVNIQSIQRRRKTKVTWLEVHKIVFSVQLSNFGYIAKQKGFRKRPGQSAGTEAMTTDGVRQFNPKINL